MAETTAMIGSFLAGMVVALGLGGLLIPLGSHIMHVRLRTRRYDFELVTGYGMSHGARVRFGERIRERRAEALPIEPSPTQEEKRADD